MAIWRHDSTTWQKPNERLTPSLAFVKWTTMSSSYKTPKIPSEKPETGLDNHPTQVGLVLPRGKKIFQVCRGFELGSTGQKAAMLAPRPRLLHIFVSKSMNVIFLGFSWVFFTFFSLYIIFGWIFLIFKAQKTLDSTELDLWDCLYSNCMTPRFYQKKIHTCTFVHFREIQNLSFSY